MPRKTLVIATAFLALVLPATAQARHGVKRVTMARVVTGHAPVLAHVTAKRQVPADCPNADVTPSAGNLDAVRAAIVCLHNQIRARKGLPLLTDNAKLRRAAEGHSADMARARYFEHTTPSGTTMVDRILAAGYVRADQGWLLGENLEWGTGSLATPRGAMDAWMNSPGHKANILKRGYRHMGIGISLGIPVAGGGDGATITVDFGVRR